jgi:hypothetical protein
MLSETKSAFGGNFKTKIAGGVAAGVLLASVLVNSAFAATDVKIDGNGPFSHNGAAVIKVKKSKVKQKNITVVGTGVVSVQNTGKNKTSFNVGGTNSITTGNNTTTTNVNVAGGSNTNTGENCCCDGGDVDVEITDNGAFSHNGALVLDVCNNKVKQTNVTVVETSVTSVQNTGGNSASFNVGGDNTIDTGNNSTTTTVTVTGSTNTN